MEGVVRSRRRVIRPVQTRETALPDNSWILCGLASSNPGQWHIWRLFQRSVGVIMSFGAWIIGSDMQCC